MANKKMAKMRREERMKREEALLVIGYGCVSFQVRRWVGATLLVALEHRVNRDFG
jgi:hypothetical protein